MVNTHAKEAEKAMIIITEAVSRAERARMSGTARHSRVR
jgi:hypothetical protein